VRADTRNQTVIFVCSFNSVRSPIAEGFLQGRGTGKYSVCSAGIAPIRVRPGAIRVMQEINIDITAHIPASIYQYRNQEFDYVVTLCDNIRTTTEEVLKGGERFIHRNFVSPSEIGRSPEDALRDYREVRDEIGLWIEETFPQPLQDPPKGTRTDSPDRATNQQHIFR